MQKPFQDGLTAEERRLVRRWTWGLFAFYGVVLVSALTIASLAHDRGAKEIASARLRPAAADADRTIR